MNRLYAAVCRRCLVLPRHAHEHARTDGKGIRIVKYYAWEASFVERISALRDVEVDKVRTCDKIQA